MRRAMVRPHARAHSELQRPRRVRAGRDDDYWGRRIIAIFVLVASLAVAASSVEFWIFWFWNFSSSLGSVGGVQVRYPAQPSKATVRVTQRPEHEPPHPRSLLPCLTPGISSAQCREGREGPAYVRT